MTQPELTVRQSGYGGRGYAIPVASPDEEGKVVTTAGGKLKARLNDKGGALIVPGVTTVLKAAASPAITQWAVDQTAGYAASNAAELLRRSPDAAFFYLRYYHKREPMPLEEGYDPRNYHLGVLDDSAQLGTAIHEWMQADAGEGEYPDISTKNHLFFEMVEEWAKWSGSQFIEPVFTEATVYNSELGYAGTLDCLWRINGKLTLLDMKSSRGLWPDHSRQLSALKNADVLLLKNADGVYEHHDWQEWIEQVEDYGFLHVRPSDVDNNGEVMLPYCEYIEAKNLDVHWEAFKACLTLKKAEAQLKELEGK